MTRILPATAHAPYPLAAIAESASHANATTSYPIGQAVNELFAAVTRQLRNSAAHDPCDDTAPHKRDGQ